jgi:hypothetical protein
VIVFSAVAVGVGLVAAWKHAETKAKIDKIDEYCD